MTTRLATGTFLICCLITGKVATAQPPTVTFPLPNATPGIQLPFNLMNGVNPFAGDTLVDYGKQATGNFGWAFDTFQGSSISGSNSLGRYAPTLMYDSFDPPPTLPVVAMLENRDWVFHMEFRYRGTYGAPGNGEFVLFAKHVPADSGGTLDGREDRIFNLTRGSDANSWSIQVGNATGGWTTAFSNLQHTMDAQANPPEQYVDFDVHYKAAQDAMDFYWESQLVGTASTGHGRYDLDFIQFEHKDSWGGTQDFRNFRLGALDTAIVDGDYNGNQIVDAADYVVWRKNLNAAGNPGEVPGDGDDGTGTGTPDGLVDQDDYSFWRSRFGATTPLGSGTGGVENSGATVPEPSGLILLTIATMLLAAAARLRA